MDKVFEVLLNMVEIVKELNETVRSHFLKEHELLNMLTKDYVKKSDVINILNNELAEVDSNMSAENKALARHWNTCIEVCKEQIEKLGGFK